MHDLSATLDFPLNDTQHVDPPADIVRSSAGPLPGLEHRDLRDDDFWRVIPAFAHVSAAEFHTHTFQARHSVTNVQQLRDTLGHLVPDSFFQDLSDGLQRAPMALRIS